MYHLFFIRSLTHSSCNSLCIGADYYSWFVNTILLEFNQTMWLICLMHDWTTQSQIPEQISLLISVQNMIFLYPEQKDRVCFLVKLSNHLLWMPSCQKDTQRTWEFYCAAIFHDFCNLISQVYICLAHCQVWKYTSSELSTLQLRHLQPDWYQLIPKIFHTKQEEWSLEASLPIDWLTFIASHGVLLAQCTPMFL